MDIQPNDFRRMSVEEFDTTKLLAHAARQAKERGYERFPIVDVDSHHYENEFDAGDPRIPRRSRPQAACDRDLAAQRQERADHEHHGRLPGHGWPHPALRTAQLREDAARGEPARRRADQALDGRRRRRRRGAVPDADAGARRAPAGGGRDRAVARLQPLALREGARARGAAGLHALSAVQRPGRDLRFREGVRRQEGRGRLPDHLDALPPGARQPVHEDLRAARGDGEADRLPRLLSLARPGAGHAQPFHLGACARLRLVQHDPSRQLDHQRHPRALSQAQGGLARKRARLDPVHDAALRQRIHDAHVGGPCPQEAAVRLHARHVLGLPADGGHRHGPAAGDHARDQRGNAARLLVRLSALGFRPAVDDLRPAVPERYREAQHPRRQCRPSVQSQAWREEARTTWLEGSAPCVRSG